MRTWWSIVVIGLGVLGPQVPGSAQGPERLVLASSRHAQPNQQASEGPDALIERLARTYPSPEALARFLRDAFAFQRDPDLFGEVERWQSPEEFVRRKAGDCEDYAVLATAILRRNGFEAYVLSLFGEEGYAHTVSVFVDHEGRYNMINQDRLRYYRATSLEALAWQLYPAWTVGAIAEPDGLRGRVITTIVNPSPAPSFRLIDPVIPSMF